MIAAKPVKDPRLGVNDMHAYRIAAMEPRQVGSVAEKTADTGCTGWNQRQYSLLYEMSFPTALASCVLARKGASLFPT